MDLVRTGKGISAFWRDFSRRIGQEFEQAGESPYEEWRAGGMTARDESRSRQDRQDRGRAAARGWAEGSCASGRDIVIARFDPKKDHRELQTTSGGNMFTFKAGLSKDRTPDIEIVELSADTFLVSRKAALAAGEYLLSASAMGVSGYDFGFHPAK